MTKITYESQYGTVTIVSPKEDMDIFEVADDLLKPMLYAVGYADGSIKDVFWSDEEQIEVEKETEGLDNHLEEDFYGEGVPERVREDQMEFDFGTAALNQKEKLMEKVLNKKVLLNKKGGKKNVK